MKEAQLGPQRKAEVKTKIRLATMIKVATMMLATIPARPETAMRIPTVIRASVIRCPNPVVVSAKVFNSALMARMIALAPECRSERAA